MATPETRTALINIRALNAQRSLIDRAAAVSHKSRSDFMLEAACREAENVLLNQRIFFVNDEEYQEFERTLRADVTDNPALSELLTRKAPWEK